MSSCQPSDEAEQPEPVDLLIAIFSDFICYGHLLLFSPKFDSFCHPRQGRRL